MKKVTALLLVGVLALSLAACGGGSTPSGSAAAQTPAQNSGDQATQSGADATADEPTFSLKLAENQPADNPISKGMQMFADLVAEKTNGSVTVEVYLDAQLGNENETIDQIQAGTLDFARINTSALAVTADSVGVFTLPYIFTSTEHKYNVLDGEIGQEVGKGLEEYNMIALEYWEAGSRNFYTTKKPVESVADVQGMKLRVQQSDVAIKMVELLGAAATPMAYGEVYQGLQTGVIDGAENDFVSYYTSGHYEVAKFYSLDAHMAPPAMLLMSKSVWDKLTENQQSAVAEAARESAKWQRQAMQEYQDEARAAVEAVGCEIFEVNVQEFQDKVAEIYDMYPQYADVIERIKALS